jgi:PIN domain nuclease of toxin-antitoxin system
VSRLLVDTLALLWWLGDGPALSSVARDAIAAPSNEPLVSVATIWEIAIKRSIGKLTAPDDLPDRILGEGFALLPISQVHAWEVRDLPVRHRDPFDRLLVAQGLIERLPIVTADTRLGAYGITVLW